MCVETLRTGLIFSEMIDLRGPMLRFTLKMNYFTIYVLRKHRKYVLKASEQCLFLRDDDF